jgi:hypothetical protein
MNRIHKYRVVTPLADRSLTRPDSLPFGPTVPKTENLRTKGAEAG